MQYRKFYLNSNECSINLKRVNSFKKIEFLLTNFVGN